MSDDELSVEDLRLQQVAQERAERRELAQASTDAEADKHRRRADKAGYLREKLEAQQRADLEADVEER